VATRNYRRAEVRRLASIAFARERSEHDSRGTPTERELRHRLIEVSNAAAKRERDLLLEITNMRHEMVSLRDENARLARVLAPPLPEGFVRWPERRRAS